MKLRIAKIGLHTGVLIQPEEYQSSCDELVICDSSSRVRFLDAYSFYSANGSLEDALVNLSKFSIARNVPALVYGDYCFSSAWSDAVTPSEFINRLIGEQTAGVAFSVLQPLLASRLQHLKYLTLLDNLKAVRLKEELPELWDALQTQVE